MTHTESVTLALWLGFWIRLKETAATTMTGIVTRHKHKVLLKKNMYIFITLFLCKAF